MGKHNHQTDNTNIRKAGPRRSAFSRNMLIKQLIATGMFIAVIAPVVIEFGGIMFNGAAQITEMNLNIAAKKKFTSGTDSDSIKSWKKDVAYDPIDAARSTSLNGMVIADSAAPDNYPVPNTAGQPDHTDRLDSAALKDTSILANTYYSGDYDAKSNYRFNNFFDHNFTVWTTNLEDNKVMMGKSLDSMQVFQMETKTKTAPIVTIPSDEDASNNPWYSDSDVTLGHNKLVKKTNLIDTTSPILRSISMSAQNGDLVLDPEDEGSTYYMGIKAQTKDAEAILDNNGDTVITFELNKTGDQGVLAANDIYTLSNIVINSTNWGAPEGYMTIQWPKGMTMARKPTVPADSLTAYRDSMRLTNIAGQGYDTKTASNGDSMEKIYFDETKIGMRANWKEQGATFTDEINALGTHDTAISTKFSVANGYLAGDQSFSFGANGKQKADVMIKRYLNALQFTGVPDVINNPTGGGGNKITITLSQDGPYTKSYRDADGHLHYYKPVQHTNGFTITNRNNSIRNNGIGLVDAYNEAKSKRYRGLPGYLTTDAGDIGEHVVIGGLSRRHYNGWTAQDGLENIWWTGGTRQYYSDTGFDKMQDHVGTTPTPTDSAARAAFLSAIPGPGYSSIGDDATANNGTLNYRNQDGAIVDASSVAAKTGKYVNHYSVDGKRAISDPLHLFWTSGDDSVDMTLFRAQPTGGVRGNYYDYQNTVVNDGTTSSNATWYWMTGPEAGELIQSRGTLTGHEYWNSGEPNNDQSANEVFLNIWGNKNNNTSTDSQYIEKMHADGLITDAQRTAMRADMKNAWSDGRQFGGYVGTGYIEEYSPYDADHNGEEVGDGKNMDMMPSTIALSRSIGIGNPTDNIKYSDIIKDEAKSDVKGAVFAVSFNPDSNFFVDQNAGTILQKDENAANRQLPLIKKEIYQFPGAATETAALILDPVTHNIYYKGQEENEAENSRIFYDVTKNLFYSYDGTKTEKDCEKLTMAWTGKPITGYMTLELVKTNDIVVEQSELSANQRWYDGTKWDGSKDGQTMVDYNGDPVVSEINPDTLTTTFKVQNGKLVDYGANSLHPSEGNVETTLTMPFSLASLEDIVAGIDGHSGKENLDKIFVHTLVVDREGNYHQEVIAAADIKYSTTARYQFKEWKIETPNDKQVDNANYGAPGDDLPKPDEKLPRVLLTSEKDSEGKHDSNIAKDSVNDGWLAKYIYVDDNTGYWAPGATSGYRRYELVRYGIEDFDKLDEPDVTNTIEGSDPYQLIEHYTYNTNQFMGSNQFPSGTVDRLPIYGTPEYKSIDGYNPIYDVKFATSAIDNDSSRPNYWIKFNSVAAHKSTTFYYIDATPPNDGEVVITPDDPGTSAIPGKITFVNNVGQTIKVPSDVPGTYKAASIALNPRYPVNGVFDLHAEEPNLAAELQDLYGNIDGTHYTKPEQSFDLYADVIKRETADTTSNKFLQDGLGTTFKNLMTTGNWNLNVASGTKQLDVQLVLEGKVYLEVSDSLWFEDGKIQNASQTLKAKDSIELRIFDYQHKAEVDKGETPNDFAVIPVIYDMVNAARGTDKLVTDDRDGESGRTAAIQYDTSGNGGFANMPIVDRNFTDWRGFDDGGYQRKFSITKERLQLMIAQSTAQNFIPGQFNGKINWVLTMAPDGVKDKQDLSVKPNTAGGQLSLGVKGDIHLPYPAIDISANSAAQLNSAGFINVTVPAGMTFIPVVADGWSYTVSGNTYTFHPGGDRNYSDVQTALSQLRWAYDQQNLSGNVTVEIHFASANTVKSYTTNISVSNENYKMVEFSAHQLVTGEAPLADSYIGYVPTTVDSVVFPAAALQSSGTTGAQTDPGYLPVDSNKGDYRRNATARTPQPGSAAVKGKLAGWDVDGKYRGTNSGALYLSTPAQLGNLTPVYEYIYVGKGNGNFVRNTTKWRAVLTQAFTGEAANIANNFSTGNNYIKVANGSYELGATMPDFNNSNGYHGYDYGYDDDGKHVSLFHNNSTGAARKWMNYVGKGNGSFEMEDPAHPGDPLIARDLFTSTLTKGDVSIDSITLPNPAREITSIEFEDIPNGLSLRSQTGMPKDWEKLAGTDPVVVKVKSGATQNEILAGIKSLRFRLTGDVENINGVLKLKINFPGGSQNAPASFTASTDTPVTPVEPSSGPGPLSALSLLSATTSVNALSLTNDAAGISGLAVGGTTDSFKTTLRTAGADTDSGFFTVPAGLGSFSRVGTDISKNDYGNEIDSTLTATVATEAYTGKFAASIPIHGLNPGWDSNGFFRPTNDAVLENIASGRVMPRYNFEKVVAGSGNYVRNVTGWKAITATTDAIDSSSGNGFVDLGTGNGSYSLAGAAQLQWNRGEWAKRYEYGFKADGTHHGMTNRQYEVGTSGSAVVARKNMVYVGPGLGNFEPSTDGTNPIFIPTDVTTKLGTATFTGEGDISQITITVPRLGLTYDAALSTSVPSAWTIATTINTNTVTYTITTNTIKNSATVAAGLANMVWRVGASAPAGSVSIAVTPESGSAFNATTTYNVLN
ncbi:MAG: hypothetical protein LBN08_05650 [Lactobacillales bacterium]|jgi:hypothetical protein|nr:hypothetical protein [Lactobacillales bacterium]